MKKTTRKLISLLLFSVLLLSIALPAFAAPPEDEIAPQATCGHGSCTTPTESGTGVYVYNNRGTHCERIKVVKKCKLCYATLTSYKLGAAVAHDNKFSYATCDGNNQTWYYWCTKCNHDTVGVTHPCYGAPHGSVCQWLPS